MSELPGRAGTGGDCCVLVLHLLSSNSFIKSLVPLHTLGGGGLKFLNSIMGVPTFNFSSWSGNSPAGLREFTNSCG